MFFFDRMFTWIFRSFRIEGDIHMLEHLASTGIKRGIIIRRSWIFWLFHIWILIMIVGFLGADAMMVPSLYVVPIYTMIHDAVLIFFVVILSLAYIYYLFRLIQGEEYLRKTWELDSLIQIIRHSKGAFRLLFNVTFFSEIGVWILFLGSIVLMKQGSIGFISLSSLLLGAVFILLMFFRKRMLDLELDYTIVTKNQVVFTNQSGMLSSTQAMESDRVKVMQYSYPSRFASILNYGTIHLYSGGDDKHEVAATMNMYYVRSPEETLEAIESVLQKKK